MKHTPLTLVSSQGQVTVNPRNSDAIAAFDGDIKKGKISSNAATAAEKLAKRAETTARAVIAAEAIVAMALSAVTEEVGNLNTTAQETLLAAQKAAAKTLLIAKEDAEETLTLEREVAKKLLEEACKIKCEACNKLNPSAA